MQRRRRAALRSRDSSSAIVSGQLVALGHTAAWDRTNDKMVTQECGINVLVEGFMEHHVGIVSQMHAAGARFLILATEEPTYRGNAADSGSWESMSESNKALHQASWIGFNHGTQKEMVERQRVFPMIAPYIEGIIHLVPGDHVTRWYSQFAPSAYTELGYAPRLLRQNAPIIVTDKNGARRIIPEPDYEFGFYGSLTPRRYKLLRKLAKKVTNQKKAIITVVDFRTGAERDNEMRRAKVILQVRKFDEMGLVSSSRCNTALSIGRPVLAEPHDLCKPWDEVIRFSKSEESFFDEATPTLARRQVRRLPISNCHASRRPSPPRPASAGRYRSSASGRSRGGWRRERAHRQQARHAYNRRNA